MNPTTKTAKPIIGFFVAANGAGKDTAMHNVRKLVPEIQTIHMSTLLKPVVAANPEYQELSDRGMLLPPEVAIKTFRRKLVELTKDRNKTPPDILGNGPCRDPFEANAELSMINRMHGANFDVCVLLLRLEKELILHRAKCRTEERRSMGLPPRPEDSGGTPLFRYEEFMRSVNPILDLFSKRGHVIYTIDAGQLPGTVASQIAQIYRPGTSFDLSVLEKPSMSCAS